MFCSLSTRDHPNTDRAVRRIRGLQGQLATSDAAIAFTV
jgi:hypothetical protein